MAAYTPVASDPRNRVVPILITQNAPFVRGFPKFSKLKNRAIVADLNNSPVDIMRRHKTGINVAYANASAQFVPLKAFEKAQYGSLTWKSLGRDDWIAFTGGRLQDNYVLLNPKPTKLTGYGVWNLMDSYGN